MNPGGDHKVSAFLRGIYNSYNETNEHYRRKYLMYTIFITTMLFIMTSMVIMRAKEVFEENV